MPLFRPDARNGAFEQAIRALPRRTLLRRAFALAIAGFAGAPAVARPPGPPRFSSDPFSLGVASGFPDAGSVVLWTRLAPAPQAPDGGLDPVAIAVDWEVAEDEAFARIVRSGRAVAAPERAHAVHVEVDGLAAGRWYWYRFRAGDATSPTGRTRTAPAPDARPDRLRLAICSCQHYEYGYYGALRHLADEAPELIVHLGDYIYEGRARQGAVRRHWDGEPKTLAGYRARWAQYKTDADLQRAHAVAPWLYTWDDHEVENDYADDRAQDLAPDFLLRRAAAYQACFEHMPLRGAARPQGPQMRMHGRWAFGDLAEFFVLDTRQHRSHQACPKPGRGGSNVVRDCDALGDPARTMLGAGQERWLADGLATSRARWSVLAQQTLLAHADLEPGPGERVWTDGWSGYPAARDRLVAALARPSLRNPLVLGGDVHAHYVCDVRADARDPASALVATEFCGTSITSPSLAQSQIDAVRAENPQIRFADGTRRGYLSLTLERERCTARLRVIDDPKDPETAVATCATFIVEDGRPGALAG